MKKILLSAILGVICAPSFAQKIIDKSLPYQSGKTVNLNLRFGDSIRVRYWDKQEVSVHMSVKINQNKLNDAFRVTDMTTADEIVLKTDIDKEKIKEGKGEDCPGEKSTWSSDDGKNRYYVCSEINYQVTLPRNAKLKLETINGNIDIQGATAAVAAKTISGFVDMSWPKSKGANVAVKTVTGEVYSDLDIDFGNKKEKNPIVGYLLEGKINGGGPDVKLESISNNVYLRRKD
ncbi:hypothetical protein [Dyadobacter jiangsuensis]|uniref:Adhesin n=1 Tax=Dyadobacter jiangsuensis TaxID=1591085 RepID=A0A2P8G1R5_9BACT|nr:hypothetical protein [Dyadobacter jiangsuensis]PSL27922.1 hypothetical protein CLV60_107187 [Dyadobacter jiangsuensis]